MKRYRFRLAQVQRVREVQEELARAELQAARVAVVAAEGVVAERLAAHHEAVEPSGSRSASTWLAERAHRQALAAGVAVAVRAREDATVQADARRVGWSAAATRVAALERLDARRREEHALERRRAEDAATDDLVVSRFGRRS